MFNAVQCWKMQVRLCDLSCGSHISFNKIKLIYSLTSTILIFSRSILQRCRETREYDRAAEKHDTTSDIWACSHCSSPLQMALMLHHSRSASDLLRYTGSRDVQSGSALRLSCQKGFDGGSVLESNVFLKLQMNLILLMHAEWQEETPALPSCWFTFSI